MSIQNALSCLQKIQEELVLLEHPNRRLDTLIRYELMPTIQNDIRYNSEYERRARYYLDLPTSPEYKKAVNDHKEGLRELWQNIDPKKLPTETERDLQLRDIKEPTKVVRMSMRNFHAAMVDGDRWFEMGEEHFGSFSDDSIFLRWREMMKLRKSSVEYFLQKLKILDLLCADTEFGMEMVQSAISTLTKLLEESYHLLAIKNFERLAWYVQGMDQQMEIFTSSHLYSILQHDIEIVCYELLRLTEKMEDETLKFGSEDEMKNVSYLNIITNFGKRAMWREEDESVLERFNKNSSVAALWRYLLEHLDEENAKNDIVDFIVEQTEREAEQKSHDLGKTLDNLKRKLSSISGESLKVIATWFKETKDTLCLKKLD